MESLWYDLSPKQLIFTIKVAIESLTQETGAITN